MSPAVFRAALAENADEDTYFSCPFMSSKSRAVYRVHRVILLGFGVTISETTNGVQ